jgi:hypothetical protein
MVCNLGRKLADAEIRWGVTTGCGWATSLSKVDKVSNALSDSGIGDITVSVDNSHLVGKHVEFVNYFLNRLVDLGVPTRISCTSNNDELKIPISYPESALVSVEYFYVAPVGFAKNLKVRKNYFDFSKSVCPMSEGLTLSVWPSGEVFPCCSTYIVNKEKAMVIGNVYESSISQILKAALDDRYLLTIRKVGFSGLAILSPGTDAWKEAMSSPTIDVCHMCSKLAASGGTKNFRDELNSLGEVGMAGL